MDAKYLNIIFRGSRVLLLTVLLVGILTAGDLAVPGDTILSGAEVAKYHGNQSSSKVGRFQILKPKSKIIGGIATFRQLGLFPNIETIGVVVSGDNLPKTAELMYRQSKDAGWRIGHPLMRIDDGRLVGSLFELSPATSYNIKVVDGATEIIGSVTTQPEELQFIPSLTLHVDDDAAPGGDGSEISPFQSIQDGLNHATPGSQVLVADGLYHEEITFPTSGSNGDWIQVKAKGNGAILDGSKTLKGEIWKPYDKAKVWFMKVEGHFEYLARDQQRFYNYDSLRSLLEGRGDKNEPISEGWYLEKSTLKLYVRSQFIPANHTWQVPRLNHAFNIDSQDWVWIEGFEMQFYGTQLDGCGVCAKNASHLVIRKNKIHNMQLGIFINWTGGDDRGNDTRIEYNEIYDPPVNEWPWNAVKGSSMEGTAIVLRGHIGAIVRGNELHHFFNGIYTGSSAALENSELAFDIDVYNNYIHHISDDALEPEGACINHRFRNNKLESVFVGASLAPVTMGPTWVMRSTFANYTGRGIKWARNSDGIALIYHNTFWTTAQDIAAMDFISPAHNSRLRNNIFQNIGYGIYAHRTGSSGHDWDNNNWYSAQSPHFIWENVAFATITELCMATGLGCNSHEEYPGLTNPNTGNFRLTSSSPNIDGGAVISGINDGYSGSAPDVGAYESIFAVDPPPIVLSILRSDQNPTDTLNVNFTVTFSEPVTGVNISPPFNDFVLTTDPGITHSTITSVTPLSGTTYAVNVETGSGIGNIRLDLVDDNTILNAAGTPLGGANISDGNYNSGEMYTIESNSPRVINILRADSNPTPAESVSYSVSFSEPVSGVDVDDFFLTTTGSISGAVVTTISGSGSNYLVSVFAGSGEGGLQINLQDKDSIINPSGTPLGGPGAGNGDFTMGETYIIDKSNPIATGIFRADANPTAADVVDFTVVFTEPVSGVDLNDFPLSISGNLSGAYITGISGTDNLFTISVNTGSGDGTLRLNILDNDSILDNAGSPLGGIGAGNGNFNIGEIYTIDKTAPIVTGSLRSAPNPTSADNVTFRVGFMEAVYGVDVSDFTLTTTGNITGAIIKSVSGSENMYTITASTGIGNGNLRLDVIDNDSIVNALGNPLGGAGVGNGIFTTGEEYTINKIPVKLITETFTSSGKYDGWVLETSESSEMGGLLNSKATTFVLGDNAQKSQYRSILHFPTRWLPNNIVITRVLLMIKKNDLVGTNPFETHQNILADIHDSAFGYFGLFSYQGLQNMDFQSPSSKDSVGLIENNPMDDWYWTYLDSSAFEYINRYGNTQIRLRFQLDDDNDMEFDYLKFYSGDYKNRAYRPRLMVEYYKK